MVLSNRSEASLAYLGSEATEPESHQSGGLEGGYRGEEYPWVLGHEGLPSISCFLIGGPAFFTSPHSRRRDALLLLVLYQAKRDNNDAVSKTVFVLYHGVWEKTRFSRILPKYVADPRYPGLRSPRYVSAR